VAFTQGGTGSSSLAGQNTYTGATTVTAGSLSLAGALNGTPSVTTSGSGAFTETSTGSIAGNGVTFTQGSTATSTLSGSNTYTGITLINAGVLNANAADGSGYGALGNGGNITFGGGTLQYGAGAAGTDYSSRIVSSGSAIQLDTAGHAVTYNNALASSNTGGLTVLDSVGGGFSGGSLTLTAVNAYLGSTTIEGGGYLFNGNTGGALPTGTALIIGGTVNAISGGTFDLDGNNQTVAGLSSVGTGSGDIVTSSAGFYATLTVNGSGGTFAGQITDGVAGASFTLASGTETLSGNNTYSGATTVNGGTLIVSGSLSGNSGAGYYGNVNVNGGTLAGTGLIVTGNTISGPNSSVTVGGPATLAPGLSANGLSINAAAGTTGTLSLQLGSTFQLTINNSHAGTSGPAALSDYSKLTLGTGVSATLAGAISTTVGTVNSGDLFTIIIMNGPVSGIFSNSTLVSGHTYSFTSNGQSWLINYAYDESLGETASAVNVANFEAITDGDDVAIVLASVPEPGTWAMMLAGMGMLVVLQRRRRI
jgi:autotransporter-associated beta strand protein